MFHAALFLQISCTGVFLLMSRNISFAQNDSWQQMSGVLVTARSGAISFSIGAKGYISTGYDSTGNYRNMTSSIVNGDSQ